MYLEKLCFIFLLSSVITTNQCEIIVNGPGLDPENVVMPARYFFINITSANVNSYTSKLLQDLTVEIEGKSRHGLCRVWVNQLDRKDGTFIIRYKLYEPCKDFSISILYKKKHVEGSPFKYKGTILAEKCYCPHEDYQTWSSRFQCPENNPQITKDLMNFQTVNITKIEPKIWDKYKNPRSVSICHYVIKNNDVYRKCFGEHVGFNMFSDSILLSLARKMVLPDTEFFMNLGDWPLSKKIWKEPLPILSWCGSDETFDPVFPTYDLTQATLENMGGVMLDMLSVQGNSDVPWPKKVEKGFWRGRDSRLERLKLVEIAREYPDLLNASITNYFFFREKQEEYGKESLISFFKFFDHKYQINIDGTVAAYRLPYLLAGDSVVFKQDSSYYEHFYSQLIPYKHFIPFKRDLSDLVEKLQWARTNDEEVRRIASNARSFANENLLPKDIFCYHALLIKEWSERLQDPVQIKEGMIKVEQSQDAFDCDCPRKELFKDEL